MTNYGFSYSFNQELSDDSLKHHSDSSFANCGINKVEWFETFLGLDRNSDSSAIVQLLGKPTDYARNEKYITLYFDVQFGSNVGFWIKRSTGKIHKIYVFAGSREEASMDLRRNTLHSIKGLDKCESQFLGLSQEEIRLILGDPYRTTDKVLKLKSGDENVRYLGYSSNDKKCRLSFTIFEPDNNECASYMIYWL